MYSETLTPEQSDKINPIARNLGVETISWGVNNYKYVVEGRRIATYFPPCCDEPGTLHSRIDNLSDSDRETLAKIVKELNLTPLE